MNLVVDKLKFKLSIEAIEGLKATGLLVFGITFVGLLFLLSSGGEVIEETVIQDIATVETITQSIENTYELAPVEYVEPEVLSNNEVGYVDSTGEVLGAEISDDELCASKINYLYANQYACYKESTQLTACKEETVTDEYGNETLVAICITPDTQIEIVSIDYPHILWNGLDVRGIENVNIQKYAEIEQPAMVWDEENGGYLRTDGAGALGITALSPGGSVVSYEESTVKLGSPLYSKDLQDEIESKTKNEPGVGFGYLFKTNDQVGEPISGTAVVKNEDIYQPNELANSPNVLATRDAESGGYPYKSALDTDGSRQTDASECNADVSQQIEPETVHLEGSTDLVLPIECDIKSIPNVVQNLRDAIPKFDLCWFSNLVGNGDQCNYMQLRAIELSGVYGTQYVGIEGQYPLENYLYQLSSFESPISDKIVLAGVTPSMHTPVYTPSYVTTNVTIRFIDRSKPGAKWREAKIKARWAIPHEYKMELYARQSSPGMFQSDLQTMIDEAFEYNQNVGQIGNY